ncbi:MAG TPA: leucyl/phenylalanyl-tRNA--protein transferase [Vicinamibacterales bacterium]|nr:leucyl/phenylalanyl-tRNA--protein transferase [Vicinamibacterales bacterium]
MLPVDLLVSAYASGWFPMAVGGGDIRWFSPDPRGILPLDTFHVSSRLARVVRRGSFRIEINRDFPAVIRACAEAERDDEDAGTWIDEAIFDSYCAMHQAGYAHSVEAWRDGKLAGGLYGVALGGAFFGESMFHHVTDASKVALVALVERLREGGFTLLDTQWTTEHLEQFGAIDIPRAEYLRRLGEALRIDRSFG